MYRTLGRSIASLVLSLGMLVSWVGIAQAQLAKQGEPRGIASFYGSGKLQEYAPDMTVWNGQFFGQSVADAGQGVLHYTAWDCTGEIGYRSGKIDFGGGFCSLTDPDGDKINSRWENDAPNADPAKPKTKGTYLSGTGKYTGIQGGYNFVCDLIADTTHYICRMVGGEYQLP